jgi:hypothetical protein
MKKLTYQPADVVSALIFSEAHLAAIGKAEYSPINFVKNAVVTDGVVTAAVFPSTKLRAAEVVPGLRLKAGSSIIDVVKVLPTNKEVVYKNNRGGIFRMPTEKFVQLAIQQGYKKVWDVKNFLITLRQLLTPVLDSIPLMWVMKWVLNMIRGKGTHLISEKYPLSTTKLEKGTKVS